MNVLVIAPHPDDEVLGCGGTIAKHAEEGDKVYLCVVTKAYTPEWPEEFIKRRTKEVKESGKILGIRETYFLDFPTVKLDTIPQKDLNDAISRVVDKVNPDIAYIPHRGDLNMDHRITHGSVLVALRPLGRKFFRILAYEVLSETEWGRMLKHFVPNVYVDIGDTIKKKLDAMKVYGTELKKSPHPRSLEIMEVLAKKRGSEVGLKFAEAFMLVREVLS